MNNIVKLFKIVTIGYICQGSAFFSSLNKCGQVLTSLDKIRQVLTRMDKFEQVWTSLNKFG